MNGTIGILNVGAGDTKLTFDKANPAERERAAKIVAEMIQRGYSILVQVGVQKHDGREEPIFRRAHGFDAETCEYIIAAGPDEEIAVGDLLKAEAPAEEKRRPGAPRKNKGDRVRIPADRTRAVSVGRSAGG